MSAARPAGELAQDALREALARQFHAGLVMLRRAMVACPDDLWVDDAVANPFWRVAYHALFYTHFYLHVRADDFQPWARHRPNVHRFGESETEDAGPAPAPYSKRDLLDYWTVCVAFIEPALGKLDLASPDSGFDWYPIPKLEFVLVDLRHLGHHTGQLCDRIRAATGAGVDWSGSPGRGDDG